MCDIVEDILQPITVLTAACSQVSDRDNSERIVYT